MWECRWSRLANDDSDADGSLPMYEIEVPYILGAIRAQLMTLLGDSMRRIVIIAQTST